jgi:hypothetical protein
MPQLEFEGRCDPRIPLIEKLMKKLRWTGTVIESKEDLSGRQKFVG